jgi:stearoyl-CoA desaturase (delta-9 desaturase)
VARVTAVQHMTFFINSLCHTVGRQPYSSRHSARDSWIMALFTFGEGYHNFHHEFQHDYRNGVRWWQWDPTKWSIWVLEKVRLVTGLRRVPDEKILLVQLAETKRRVGERLACVQRPLPERVQELLQASLARLDGMAEQWSQLKADCVHQADTRVTQAQAAVREMRLELRRVLELLELEGTTA